MKKILLIISVVILIFLFIAMSNDPKIIIAKLAKNGDLEAGELRYRIKLFGLLPLAEATIRAEKAEEYRGEKVYHLSASAKTIKMVSKFLKGEASLDSFVDMQGLSPIAFKQRVRVSGKSDVDKEIIYDQRQGIMSIGDVHRQIPAGTQDPLSAIFSLKKMDFDKIKEFEMNINTNQKNYILKGRATSKEIAIKGKTYKIAFLEVSISRRDKNPYHKSRIKMVLLRGKENTPVLIKVFAGGVSLSAQLIDIKP
jgi:hypothetical protein